MRKGLIIILIVLGLLVLNGCSQFGGRTTQGIDPWIDYCSSVVDIELSACISENTIQAEVRNNGNKEIPKIDLRLYTSGSNIKTFSLEGVNSSELKLFSNISWPGEINNVKRVELIPHVLNEDDYFVDYQKNSIYPCTWESSVFPVGPIPSEPLPNC